MDTYKQHFLQSEMKKRGEERSWRQVLLDLDRQGMSFNRMVVYLSQNYGVIVDAKSVRLWLKQAQIELKKVGEKAQ